MEAQRIVFGAVAADEVWEKSTNEKIVVWYDPPVGIWKGVRGGQTIKNSNI